jgi:hypothetical protein
MISNVTCILAGGDRNVWSNTDVPQNSHLLEGNPGIIVIPNDIKNAQEVIGIICSDECYKYYMKKQTSLEHKMSPKS